MAKVPASPTGTMRCWNLVLVAEKTPFLMAARGSRSIFSHLHARRASDPSPGTQGLWSPCQHVAAGPCPRCPPRGKQGGALAGAPSPTSAPHKVPR